MKTLLLFSVLLISCWSYAQKAMTFGEAEEQHMPARQLDSIYKSGIHSDTSLAVFKTNQQEYIDAYQHLLKELGSYLQKNDFSWPQTTKGFNRIYFDKSGKIDYFLYNFRPGQLTSEQEKRFGELLGQFIATYRFPLSASVKFAQCSPVTYVPAN